MATSFRTQKSFLICLYFLLSHLVTPAATKIDRKSVVGQFNPKRNASSTETPMQVGNGNFVFSTDVTGLQTFQPFNALSSWGWHNSSLPTVPGQTSIGDFTGLQWWTHGRLVTYDQPNPAEANISQWLIANPHRINLVRIGFHFEGRNVVESDLRNKSQHLDLYSGIIYSQFALNNSKVTVQTAVNPDSDTVAVQINSTLLNAGDLGVFFDYPYASGQNKFDAPFVGLFNATSNHTTSLRAQKQTATIQHDLDATTYFTAIEWQGHATMTGPKHSTHRYFLSPNKGNQLSFTARFTPAQSESGGAANDVFDSSETWWQSYWNHGAFILFPLKNHPRAKELQRRVILSQYLVTINEAGRDPPQESGLTNNGWYGKFHLEMVIWHSLHFGLWGKEDLLERHDDIYRRFLGTSRQRAREMGYEGARWGKMTDPSGRSAPGEINSLLIWQQPHPFYFAEAEYQRSPNNRTLKKWDEVLTASADFMTSYVFYNRSLDVLQLGPPMYPVSENTNPNDTVNPTFELAYWRFGLDIAAKWKQRQNQTVPQAWTSLTDSLPPIPTENGTYVIYTGVPDMWNDPDLTSDHPSMAMIYGFISPPPDFSLTIFNNTMQRIYQTWNFTESFGWDFPMLAMAAARLGDYERAVDFLLDPNFQFDDLGMPIGGSRVPTPYFPGSASLLMAVAMMSGGWKEDPGLKFPKEWKVQAEGFRPMFF
ncbi:uncharacterized protein Z518_05429 [Rhinocladiella mackenziei CBS 650.93]|uniref:Six-hairpin glycosidase-like protein n=1 Tax=Rhinocladiella mackenziei CBS 650.93 TaxID=1442369 RepID=A0A0D2IFH1_9EURO|nr:uncharacterized protein Z518_05429 [Rhinocladiella mackenziei CBS 650.93]KIX04559.1 hypothetical protein Z518_05429 [Rhinocladiella mackenziei CBS 650.93]